MTKCNVREISAELSPALFRLGQTGNRRWPDENEPAEARCVDPSLLAAGALDTDFYSVNNRSILSLKKRALRRTKTLRRDPETQEVLPPSKLSVWKSRIQAPFTRSFWEERLERTDSESLVDSKLLSYAYLEAGVIEMVGA